MNLYMRNILNIIHNDLLVKFVIFIDLILYKKHLKNVSTGIFFESIFSSFNCI